MAVTSSSGPRPAWALALSGVGKQFGATHALRDVSFEVRPGEVHALLGHNGCGKSTLVKIISGFQSADTGSISVAAAEGGAPRIGIVHQDLGLCRPATVVENCGMGTYARRFGLIDWKRERRAVAAILASLGADFGLDDVVEDLSPADQAITAIARALKASGGLEGLDLLVLDEATAALRGPDAEKVLASARAVAAHGGGVLLVTHHMSEVLTVADRATVLASGQVVDTVDVAAVTEDDLLALISGGRVPPPVSGGSGPAREATDQVLEVRGLTGAGVHQLSFGVRPGEIVGLTGAAGAGHDDVPYLVCGVTRRVAGEVVVDAAPYTGRSVRDAQRSRLGVLPADRLRRGVVPRGSVRENLSPASRPAHRTGGLLRVRREKTWAQTICRDYAVVPADPELPMSALSGGNQQKVLFARVLEHDPRIVVLHEPTQGVDEGTRRALMRRVRDLVDRGLGVLYVSSDAEEVAECADRVLVMRRGALVGELPAGTAHIDEIYAACYAMGESAAHRTTTEGSTR
ncbi:sugar ABC transporter ATP-binding protein [Geodermatophilus sp. CPCC 206100]|uniref:sugar ABC transporter ATP-binding protein n=1 Tax=Geodermatophilus sp. CPCC 206100 TaxID=3020054 RepID=UPI003B00B646